MGLISRHSGAPFANGEAPDGTDDVEVDLSRLYELLGESPSNGNLEDANFSASAAINAAKVVDAGITAAKFADGTITHNKCADNIVHEVATNAGLASSQALSGSWTTIRDVTLSDPENDGVRLILCSGILSDTVNSYPSNGTCKFRITRGGVAQSGDWNLIWYGSDVDDYQPISIAYLDEDSVGAGSHTWAWQGYDNSSKNPVVSNLSMVVIDLKR